jgi:hypothetical protein
MKLLLSLLLPLFLSTNPNTLALSVIFLTARTDGPFAVNPKIASLQSLINLNADNLTSGGTASF